MSPRAEIWNILHDGPITNISGAVPGDVRLSIDIDYLRRLFPGGGDSFGLCLRGCRLLEMTIWASDSRVTNDFAEILDALPTILSTDSTDVPVRVFTTTGELSLDFDEFNLELDDGTPVSFDSICAACENYWNKVP
jgi:hypothetical protein